MAWCARAGLYGATLLLVRFRYHIITRHGEQEKPLLAEDCQVLAFAGAPQNAEWLDSDTAEALLDATPDANITPEQAADFVRRVIEGFAALATASRSGSYQAW